MKHSGVKEFVHSDDLCICEVRVLVPVTLCCRFVEAEAESVSNHRMYRGGFKREV